MTNLDNLLDRLEVLLAAGTERPWRAAQMTRFDDVRVESDQRTVCRLDDYDHRPDERRPDADLIVSLVNAAPALLRLARAAQAWRDARCERLAGCDRGDHDYECPVLAAERALTDALNGAEP